VYQGRGPLFGVGDARQIRRAPSNAVAPPPVTIANAAEPLRVIRPEGLSAWRATSVPERAGSGSDLWSLTGIPDRA
jgi:hypothetical protein